MEMNFCRRCGSELEHGKNGYVCDKGHNVFANPSAATGVALVNERKEVLLAVRAVEPGKGKLDLPGGFVELNETAEECAMRELQEELGLTSEDYGPLHIVMTVSDPYEFGGETTIALGIIYWAGLKPGAQVTPADDVAGTVTVAAKDISFERLSSPGEALALRRLIETGVI